MAGDLAVMKIKMAYSHLEKISEFEERGINGAGKLKKRIQAEINFLQKVSLHLSLQSVLVLFSPFVNILGACPFKGYPIRWNLYISSSSASPSDMPT